MGTSAELSLDALEDTYKALADRSRLRILALLVDGEVCVCDIHDTLRLPQPTASRHLAYLRRAGLVEARRDGTWMHYRMADLDPTRKAVIVAAAHAMSHVAGAGRDRHRFEKQVGKRLPVIQPAAMSCCSRS
jgi:ArsR family transcriptional regulator